MLNKIKHAMLAMLVAVGVWGQSQTPLKVYPSAAGATSEIRLYTPAGTYVGLKANASVPSNMPFVLPGEDGFPNQCLQTDGSGNWVWDNCSGGGGVSATDYDWSQTPGGSLVVGSNTVSLAPCPSDFTGAAADFPIRLSGGTGTAETVIVTGGSGSYGDASCNVTFTAAYTHTGAWTASSASGGLIEAVRESTGVGIVRLPDGTLTIDPPAPGALTNVWIYGSVQVVGVGYGRSQIQLGGDQYAIIAKTTDAVIFRDFYIVGSGTQASGGGLKITSDGLNHNCASIVEDVAFQALYNGIYFDKQCTPFIKNNRFYNIDNVAIHLENTWCADCGDPTVIGNYIQDDDNVSTCLYWVNGGGAKVIGNKFLGCAIGMDVQTAPDSTVGTDATSIAIVANNSFDQNTSRGIRFDGTITFIVVQVNNNTFTPNGAATSYIGIDYGNSASTLYFNAALNNNVFHCTDALNNTAIRVRRSTFTTIAGNTISYCLVGITVESTALSVSIGRNDFFGSGTFYNVDAAATFLPTAQIRQVSSASNVWSLAEYIQPTSAGNNAIILGNPSTGTASQRGLFWGYNAADFGIARFDSSRVAAPTFDFYIEPDGDSLVYNRLGVGVSPSYKVDIGGGAGANYLRIADSTAGTSLLAYAENGATNIGALTNHSLRMLTDNTVRWQISATGMLLPWAADTYDIGELSSARVRGVYAQLIDTAKSGGTNDYIQTRKLQLFDNSGSIASPLYWDFNVVMNGVGAFKESYLYLRNEAGQNMLLIEMTRSGSDVRRTTFSTSILPETTSTRDLGSATYKWNDLHLANVVYGRNFTASDGSYNRIVLNNPGAGSNAGNAFAFRDASGNLVGYLTYGGTFVAPTVSTDAFTLSTSPTNGYCLISDALGAGTWQACPGGLPVSDSTAVVEGSVTSSKKLRFEVDGFTAGATRVLTPQDYDYTIAGTNIAQTFSGANTFSVGQTFSGGLVTGAAITNNSANAYDLGSSSSPFNVVYGRNFTSTDGTYNRIYLNNPGSGSNAGNAFAFRDSSGNLIGYLTYGGTFVTTTVSSTNLSVSGTVTAPDSNNGVSATKTVRDAAGTGTCTLVFSGGILTGGTC